jgi:hypothetical protein
MNHDDSTKFIFGENGFLIGNEAFASSDTV